MSDDASIEEITQMIMKINTMAQKTGRISAKGNQPLLVEIANLNRMIDQLAGLLYEVVDYFDGGGEPPEETEQLEVNLVAKINGALNLL